MAILASLALLGCEQPTPPPAEATLVRAVEVQETALDKTAALTGEIQARRQSNLGFRVAGKMGMMSNLEVPPGGGMLGFEPGRDGRLDAN